MYNEYDLNLKALDYKEKFFFDEKKNKINKKIF
jgi:hypothetical protein